MFMVGGGILVHGIPGAENIIHELALGAGAVPAIGGMLAALAPTLLGAVFGVVAGAIVLGGVSLVQRLIRSFKS
jgi:predicted DNA repair protein MutK